MMASMLRPAMDSRFYQDQSYHARHEPRTPGWLRLRRGPLPADLGADVRALLPLQGLPAPDRQRLRDQRIDRSRPGPAHRRHRADPDADRQRPAAPGPPLRQLPDRDL